MITTKIIGSRDYNKKVTTFLQKLQEITLKKSIFLQTMEMGQASINLLWIELQHKSPIIFYKRHKRLQQKSICLQTIQNIKTTTNLLSIELQQKSLPISNKNK
jgi:hypothetical protein